MKAVDSWSVLDLYSDVTAGESGQSASTHLLHAFKGLAFSDHRSLRVLSMCSRILKLLF